MFLQFEYIMLYLVTLWQIIIWFPVGKNGKKIVHPWFSFIQFSFNFFETAFLDSAAQKNA